MNKFWELMEERTELCHKALRIRHDHLLGTKSDVAPMLWQHGAYARLEPGEVIDELLKHGYSTISLGYVGLAETVLYMTGNTHTKDEKSKEFGLKVMQFLNDKCAQWKAAEDIGYSVYGTPIESTTYKFAKCLKKRFGIIKGITDKNWVANSYHTFVTEEVNAFDKLSNEAEFQALSPGGAISYVETPNMQNNIPAIIKVMQHIYNTIMYAELNTKSDHCDNCGFYGEVELVRNESSKLIWKCPQCGCEDPNKLDVKRRVCGYISSNEMNQGRLHEISQRVLHL